MPVIRRGRGRQYTWSVGEAPVGRVANKERSMPRSWIRRDGFGITARARQYLLPLIQGEDYPPYQNGLPRYARLRGLQVRRKLPPSRCSNRATQRNMQGEQVPGRMIGLTAIKKP